MKNTPEGKIKHEIKAQLIAINAYYHMPVQNGMGAPTLDFIGCYKGQFFGIEAKAPGKQATPRQMRTIQSMEQAGGYCGVVSSRAEMDTFIAGLILLAT